MDKGRAEIIVERLKEQIDNAQSVPLSTGKVMVNKQDFTIMLDNLSELLRNEMKIYREVSDKRAKIINDAKKEAEEIIYQAERSASRIRVTKRKDENIPYLRDTDLAKDEREALRTAGDIYASSLIFTDEMLSEVDNMLHNTYDTMKLEYERMLTLVKDKIDAISTNKSELMSSLNDMKRDDRYAQILELSQLLSNELYTEREKAKYKALEDKDQLEFKFDENYDSELDSAFDITEDNKSDWRNDD